MFGPVRVASALAAWLCLWTFSPAPAVAAELREVTEKVFPLKPGGELVIDSQNGRITVEAWNRPEARIQITRTVRAGDAKRAAELMKELRADVTLGEGLIEVESRYPKRAESVGIWDVLGQRVSSLNIHYYVQVPAQTRLHLETSNGEIQIRGIAATVVGQTVNGDVDVTSTTGHVEVSTTNGNIRLVGIQGGTEASTTNGGIQAEIRRLDSDGEVDLSTTNGDLEAVLPANLKAKLEATTTNGSVSIGFPVEMIGRASSKLVRARIGGGGAAVSLSTTNGNIVVKRAGESRRS
jgi:putative adhesin